MLVFPAYKIKPSQYIYMNIPCIELSFYENNNINLYHESFHLSIKMIYVYLRNAGIRPIGMRIVFYIVINRFLLLLSCIEL